MQMVFPAYPPLQKVLGVSMRHQARWRLAVLSLRAILLVPSCYFIQIDRVVDLIIEFSLGEQCIPYSFFPQFFGFLE